MDYWVQTNEDMTPIRVENLSDAEAQGIVKLLQALANAGELVFIRDCREQEDLYENYDQWSSARRNVESSRSIKASAKIGGYPIVELSYNGGEVVITGKLDSPDFLHQIIQAMQINDGFAQAMVDWFDPDYNNMTWEDTTYEDVAIDMVDWFESDYEEYKALESRGRASSDGWVVISEDESIVVSG